MCIILISDSEHYLRESLSVAVLQYIEAGQELPDGLCVTEMLFPVICLLSVFNRQRSEVWDMCRCVMVEIIAIILSCNKDVTKKRPSASQTFELTTDLNTLLRVSFSF